MARQDITLKELASELSLSQTTVSLALSGKGETYRIAVETRKRIKETAERLGYTPNHLARSMRRGKTDTIGVVFPDVSETYMNHILAGIEKTALERGVSMMIATSSLSSAIESRNIETLLDRRIDGLLIIPYAPFRSENYSDEAIRRAEDSGVPVVAVDRYIRGVNRHAVLAADRKAAREVTGRLIAAGSRRPAYLGFDLAITTLEERRGGFYDALKAGELEGEAEELLLKKRNPEGGDIEEWLEKLGESRRFPDSFFVSTDGLARKLNWLLGKRQFRRYFGRGGVGRRETGRRGAALRPPLIARFGEDSPYFPTEMISVRQPHEELGRRAGEMLFSLIAGEVMQKEQQIKILEMEIVEKLRV